MLACLSLGVTAFYSFCVFAIGFVFLYGVHRISKNVKKKN